MLNTEWLTKWMASEFGHEQNIVHVILVVFLPNFMQHHKLPDPLSIPVNDMSWVSQCPGKLWEIKASGSCGWIEKS